MVCVFPELVWPYAMTVPFTPRSTASTTDLAVRAYTAALSSSASNTASASHAGAAVGAASTPLSSSRTRAGRVSTTRVPSSALNRGVACSAEEPSRSRAFRGRMRTATKIRPSASPASVFSGGFAASAPPALALAVSPRGRFVAFGGGDDPGFAARLLDCDMVERRHARVAPEALTFTRGTFPLSSFPTRNFDRCYACRIT